MNNHILDATTFRLVKIIVIDVSVRMSKAVVCTQWCSGGRATGAIAPVPVFQGGSPLQFLVHLFLVNFAYILQKLSFDLNYYW